MKLKSDEDTQQMPTKVTFKKIQETMNENKLHGVYVSTNASLICKINFLKICDTTYIQQVHNNKHFKLF